MSSSSTRPISGAAISASTMPTPASRRCSATSSSRAARTSIRGQYAVIDLNNNVSRMMPASTPARAHAPQRVAGPLRASRTARPGRRPTPPRRRPRRPSPAAPATRARDAQQRREPQFPIPEWIGAGGRWRRAPRAAAGRRQPRSCRPRSRQELQAAPGAARRQRLGAARRGGRAARPERRRQDDLLLHHHRPDRGRYRHGQPRRRRTSPICRCIAARGSASAICRRRPRSSAA